VTANTPPQFNPIVKCPLPQAGILLSGNIFHRNADQLGLRFFLTGKLNGESAVLFLQKPGFLVIIY